METLSRQVKPEEDILGMYHVCRILPVFILVLVFSFFFSGCASQPLYYWGTFEDQQYAYLKGENREAQIQAMQKDQEKIASEGKKAAPGFYAHLGMLYSDTGNDKEAIACFEMEKSLFPESAGLMDYLLKKYGR